MDDELSIRFSKLVLTARPFPLFFPLAFVECLGASPVPSLCLQSLPCVNCTVSRTALLRMSEFGILSEVIPEGDDMDCYGDGVSSCGGGGAFPHAGGSSHGVGGLGGLASSTVAVVGGLPQHHPRYHGTSSESTRATAGERLPSITICTSCSRVGSLGVGYPDAPLAHK